MTCHVRGWWTSVPLVMMGGCATPPPSLVRQDEAVGTESGGGGEDVDSIGVTEESGFDLESSAGTIGEQPGGNEPPEPRNDGPYAIEANARLEVAVENGVLSNDEDPEGDRLAVVASSTPTSNEGAIVTLAPDGGFTYEPAADFVFGTDRFLYSVSDEAGATATAEVRVVVQPADGEVRVDELGTQGIRFDGISAGDAVGVSVRDAGDVNGDGFADLIIGAYRASPGNRSTAGEAYIIFGGNALPSTFDLTEADVRLQGIEAYDHAGVAVAGAGDVNGDGFDDVVVGAHEPPNPDDPTDTPPGEVFVVFGGSDLPTIIDLEDAEVRFQGPQAGDLAGHSVSTAGDFNGDGLADLLIGAPYGNYGEGESYIVFGASDLVGERSLEDADVRLRGRNESGFAVSVAGDVDGDGLSDVLIGGPFAPLNELGRAYLVLGSETPDAAVVLDEEAIVFEGVESYDGHGRSVGTAGDVNGDGFADLLIGRPYSQRNDFAGQVVLVFGRAVWPNAFDLEAELEVVRFNGLNADDVVGLSASTAGDFNADGLADVLLSGATASFLVLGSAELAPLFRLDEADIRFDAPSTAVSTAGDLDGDGFDDLVIGLIDVPPPGTPLPLGDTYVVFGDDLTATVSALGFDADDDLAALGLGQGDVLVGGRGHDVLRGDGGPDALSGGSGDDVLHIASLEFIRLAGGLGRDTLALGEDLALDLNALGVAKIRGIERLELSADGTSSLTLSERNVLSLGREPFVVDGGADDTLTLIDGSWPPPERSGDHDLYRSQTSSAALLVGIEVQVTLPPS